jgi:hypothetical protein
MMRTKKKTQLQAAPLHRFAFEEERSQDPAHPAIARNRFAEKPDSAAELVGSLAGRQPRSKPERSVLLR